MVENLAHFWSLCGRCPGLVLAASVPGNFIGYEPRLSSWPLRNLDDAQDDLYDHQKYFDADSLQTFNLETVSWQNVKFWYLTWLGNLLINETVLTGVSLSVTLQYSLHSRMRFICSVPNFKCYLPFIFVILQIVRPF